MDVRRVAGRPAGVGQGVRLIGWQPWRSWRNPLLWIPFGFLLLALAQSGVVSGSAALHVLTVGALAGLIMGMITRTALGHAGRPFRAGRGECLTSAPHADGRGG